MIGKAVGRPGIRNAVAFIPGMRVLMGLISSTPQSLGVSLALIMIYIKKNRCEMSGTVFRYVLTANQRGLRTWD